jgi:predicted hydrocarbon binding protein
MVQLPAAALTAFHRALSQDRSPAEAAALTRQMGFESGEGFYDALRDWLARRGTMLGVTEPAGLPADEFWSALAEFFQFLGWGRLEFARLHPGIAALSSTSWAEAEPGSAARQPTCHFSTGVLADILGRVSGDNLAVLEVECRSGGDDCCRFLIGGPEALRGVYERIREGAAFPQAVESL